LAWKARGDAGLVSKRKGKSPCNRLDAEVRAAIERLLREKYADFGATLAAEKLSEIDKIAVSHETVRRIQIAIGLWKPKPA
jgi:hypothetical protein